MPKKFNVPMNPQQAASVRKQFIRRDHLALTLASFVELTNLRYSAPLQAFTAEVTYFGSELKRTDRKKDPLPPAIFARFAPEPLPAVISNAAESISFDQFAQRFGQSPGDEININDRANQQLLSRLWTARLLAKQPRMLREDDMAIRLAQRLLTNREYMLLTKEHDLPSNSRNTLTAFDKRDLAEKVRGPFKPRLLSSNARLPIAFRQVMATELGPYDFDSGSFSLKYSHSGSLELGRGSDGFALTVGLNAVALPRELVANEAQARQMDNFLRGRGDTTLYLVLRGQIKSLQPWQDNGTGFAQTGDYTVVLYADKELQQPVLDYTASLRDKQQRLSIAQEAYHRPISRRAQILRHFDQDMKEDLVAIVSERLRINREVSPTQRRQLVADAAQDLANAQSDGVFRFSGRIELGPYDADSGTVPITEISHGLSGNSGSFPFDVYFKTPIDRIPERLNVTPEQAARFSQSNVLWLRLDAKPRTEGLRKPSVKLPERYKPEIMVPLSAKRIEIFSRDTRSGLVEMLHAQNVGADGAGGQP